MTRQIIKSSITPYEQSQIVEHVTIFAWATRTQEGARGNVYRLLGIPTASEHDRNATREMCDAVEDMLHGDLPVATALRKLGVAVVEPPARKKRTRKAKP